MFSWMWALVCAQWSGGGSRGFVFVSRGTHWVEFLAYKITPCKPNQQQQLATFHHIIVSGCSTTIWLVSIHAAEVSSKAGAGAIRLPVDFGEVYACELMIRW